MSDEVGWEAEHEWLISFMRQGAPMTTAAERERVLTALRRFRTEVGDELDRVVIHEAGHAVVAHALGWFVEFVEPRMPDGGGGAMAHQPRLGYSRLRNEAERFAEQVVMTVAGYVAEEMEFGLASPFEVIALRDRAWEEHGQGDDQFPALIEDAEAQARAILTERWPTVGRLAEAQRTGGRVEGDVLMAILTGPNRN